jgi:hypothetical protein
MASAVECPSTVECLSTDITRLQRSAQVTEETTNAVKPFVMIVFTTLYTLICSNLPDCCESPPLSPCFFSTKDIPKTFQEFQENRDNRTKMFAMKVIACHSSFVGAMKVSAIKDAGSWFEFKLRAKDVEVAWVNSSIESLMDPNTGPFALALLYCRRLTNENPRTLKELGPNAILRIVDRCKAFSTGDPMSPRVVLRDTSRAAVEAYKALSSSAETKTMNVKTCESIQYAMASYLHEMQAAEQRFPTSELLTKHMASLV